LVDFVVPEESYCQAPATNAKSWGRTIRLANRVRDSSMSEPEYVDPRKLVPGPIRHESLSPQLLEMIEAIYGEIGRYLGTTLEQFEIGFMRDANPEREVSIWASITAAWLAYHEKFLNGELLPDDEEKKLLGALTAVSTGVTDLERLAVPAETGKRLLECYDGLWKK